MARARLARHSAGFTLLELLVALALFGLVVVALGGGVRFAGRTIAAEERQRDAYADLDPVQTVMRQLIEAARAIDGRGDRLEFTAPLPTALDAPGLYEISIFVADGRLMARWWAHRSTDDAQAESLSGETELARGILAVEFAYFTASASGSAEWQAMTAERAPSPLLVRMRLAVPSGDRRRWPDLVAVPAVDSALPGRG